MTPVDRLGLGRQGEDLAAAYLAAQGYRLVQRNYRCRLGEIDLVAWDGRELVFIEVKTRSTRTFGSSAEAVSSQKQARLLRLADCFLQEHRLSDAPCRFDVVAVDASLEPPGVDLIRGAFSA